MFENDPNNIHGENATNNIFNLAVMFKLMLQSVKWEGKCCLYRGLN